MTPRQRRFVAEYLIDLNATRAAMRAGYSESTARCRAHGLLKLPEVAAAVRDAMAEREARTQITADRVLKEYARIAFADIRRLTEWGPEGVALKPTADITEDDAAAIAELVLGPAKAGSGGKLKLHDKKSALDMLARHLGLLGRPGAEPAPGEGAKDGDRDGEPRGDAAADADSARARLARRIAGLARRREPG